MQKYLLYLSMTFALLLSACGSDAPKTDPPTAPDATNNVTTNPEDQQTPTTPEPQEAPDFGVFFNDFLSKTSDAEALKPHLNFPFATAPSFDEATQKYGAAKINEADLDINYFSLLTNSGEAQTGKFEEGGYLNGSLQDIFNEQYGGLSNIYYAKADAEPIGYWAYFILDNGAFKFIGAEEIESAM